MYIRTHVHTAHIVQAVLYITTVHTVLRTSGTCLCSEVYENTCFTWFWATLHAGWIRTDWSLHIAFCEYCDPHICLTVDFGL